MPNCCANSPSVYKTGLWVCAECETPRAQDFSQLSFDLSPWTGDDPSKVCECGSSKNDNGHYAWCKAWKP